jgi:hypothetical protein
MTMTMSVAVQERPRAKSGTAASDTNARRRNQWLERVEKELAAAGAAEAQKRPDALAKRLDSMVGTTDTAEVLTRADKTEISDRVRQVKLTLYERHLDYLLDETMAATRDATREAEKGTLLKQGNETFTIAMRLGLSQAMRDSVKQRLAIIRETSAAGLSTKAKAAAEREALRREAVYPNDKRTFSRWRDPPLVVVVGARTFTSANWSLSGILIDAIDLDGYQCGDVLEIQVGMSPDKLYKERIEIMRCAVEARQLAVKSRRFASVLMQVKRDCDAAQVSPA